jgi:Suppressor of fused protein (SUFU)
MDDPNGLTPLQRAVAIYSQDVFGEKAEIYTYGREGFLERSMIMKTPDCPVNGSMTSSSIGLSSHSQPSFGKAVNIEIVGACSSSSVDYGNIISSCVFECLINNQQITYGAYFANLVDQYYPNLKMKHVAFVAPFYWDNILTHKSLGGLDVYWLYALPIADGELDFLRRNGIDRLERELQSQEADVLDLNRLPIF